MRKYINQIIQSIVHKGCRLTILYIFQTSQIRIQSFRKPKILEERYWKTKPDQQTDHLLQESWNKGIRVYSINPKLYYLFPLTELPSRQRLLFRDFRKKEQRPL